MKYLKLIVEFVLWIIAFIGIIKGIKTGDALIFGYGLFILWAWLFCAHVELRSKLREIDKG